MKLTALASVVVLALVSPTSHAHAQAIADDAIKAMLTGKTVNVGEDGVANYKADGAYEYFSKASGQTARGKYSIADGRVCVDFPNRQSRCDKIIKEGDTVFIVNSSGTKYKMVVR